MHFNKIGRGCEERHRKESYVVFISKKYSHLNCSSPVDNNKMNKMAYFSYLKSTFIDFIFSSEHILLPNQHLRLLLWLEELPMVVFRCVFY